MSKPFDATLKELVTAYPVDWLTQLGVPITAPPEVLTADLSTVTAAADTLIKVGDLVVHIDLESGPDDELARRMLLYNVLAHHHTKLPVPSIVVLLRSNAVGGGPTDGVEYAPNPGVSELRFRFETVKAWELSSEAMLNAGLGFLPLAVLGKPPPGQTRLQALPAIAKRIADRAEQEAKADAERLARRGLHSVRDARSARGGTGYLQQGDCDEGLPGLPVHPRRRGHRLRAGADPAAGRQAYRRTDREAEEQAEHDRRPGTFEPDRGRGSHREDLGCPLAREIGAFATDRSREVFRWGRSHSSAWQCRET